VNNFLFFLSAAAASVAPAVVADMSQLLSLLHQQVRAH
jgi:hypothetical protein